MTPSDFELNSHPEFAKPMHAILQQVRNSDLWRGTKNLRISNYANTDGVDELIPQEKVCVALSNCGFETLILNSASVFSRFAADTQN